MQGRRRWPLIAVVLIAIALGSWAWWRRTPSSEPVTSPAKTPVPAGPDVIAYARGAPQLAMIRSQPAPALAVPVADALAARVAYDDDATARLFAPVAGRIVSLDVQPGDRVKAGQVLARIDAPDFGTARADLAKARADEERKRLADERARELGPGEGIAVKDVEAARADRQASLALLQARAARLGSTAALFQSVAGPWNESGDPGTHQ